MKILVTGGLGYIGSHTCIELLAAGHEVVAIDNLVNSKAGVAQRIAAISGQPCQFHEIDVRDGVALRTLFAREQIDAVVHFAGLKAVGESVQQPLRYYDYNVHGTQVLLEVMAEANVKTIVFSSSATVYGDPHAVPILESFPLQATNPYGRSKLMIEEILRDVAVSDSTWKIALLRYFNPVGAHESGLIGEDPNGIPNNLMPYIAQVADGRREQLSIFGNDYATPDGTGVRDYIHVVDLAVGHVKTLQKLAAASGVLTYNLGTGNGSSVLQMVQAFEQASGRRIPYQFAPRRAGDIAQCYADPSLAEQELGWRAERGIEQMCADTWRWQAHAAANLA
ncbi:UDP-galactose 4-epimerase [Duganella sacchari]|uniref:UDP-glucose 4-epimerase n=1 Tax=Duganella sacchari TaxID=551987 RepID=A0A1M7R0C9_9BURK|nr:UDP-glucose 4-epimerase GalE [Duganella sacchari]SHN38025.1 UDP-galactose 4-epimerase [Duganella sacchari]